MVVEIVRKVYRSTDFVHGDIGVLPGSTDPPDCGALNCYGTIHCGPKYVVRRFRVAEFATKSWQN